MPINYKKIENKERYITIKFHTLKPWKVLQEKIDAFLGELTEDDVISDVVEFNSLAEQMKDKATPKKSTAELVLEKDKKE
jgi:uncharacterized protein CbrC (UPF0167 family)